MELTPLTALSPIDGRYRHVTEKLVPYLSEFALIKTRVEEQVEYLIAFLDATKVYTLSQGNRFELRTLANISLENAEDIKRLEKQLNHDVVSVIAWLRLKLKNSPLLSLVEWVHFARTSEDCNNISYALMLQRAVRNVLLPALSAICTELDDLATRYADTPMLSRTHGQPATPTTLGKEFRVWWWRIQRQLEQLEEFRILVKLSGASGNWATHVVAYPHIDWLKFSREYVGSYNRGNGALMFEWNPMTTQIEPHDTYAELFDLLKRINVILIDCCKDTWQYISDDWLVQKAVAGEVGSSAMPHKVNPIDLENGEGNFGVAISLMQHFGEKLPISRLQRDLSDSTVERAFGEALGHCLVGYASMLRGLKKVSPNKAKLAEALNNHPEVIVEAIQTILRREGITESYNLLKDLSRGKKITDADLSNFISNLPITDEVKKELAAIKPSNYIGLASQLARHGVP